MVFLVASDVVVVVVVVIPAAAMEDSWCCAGSRMLRTPNVLVRHPGRSTPPDTKIREIRRRTRFHQRPQNKESRARSWGVPSHPVVWEEEEVEVSLL